MAHRPDCRDMGKKGPTLTRTRTSEDLEDLINLPFIRERGGNQLIKLAFLFFDIHAFFLTPHKGV